MKEWCLEHAYLTTTIALFTLGSITNISMQVISLFKKTSPTTVNVKVESSEEQDLTPSKTIN